MSKHQTVSSTVCYVGDGFAFIPGVPMRDLTLAEWAELTDEQRSLCKTTLLYLLNDGEPPQKDTNHATS